MTDFGETGVQTGCTAAGLSFNMPWHLSLDGSGRIYLADRDNKRVVRMDDVAGTNWTAFSGNGSDVLGLPSGTNAYVISTASEAGVPASLPAPHFTAYVDNLGFAESGLAVSNPNNVAVAATLYLRNSSGQIVASTVRTIAAFGHLAQFFTQLFAGFSQFEGTLELQTDGASLRGVGVRYDNLGGSVFTTPPVTLLP